MRKSFDEGSGSSSISEKDRPPSIQPRAEDDDAFAKDYHANE
jgi:hypothetical protein